MALGREQELRFEVKSFKSDGYCLQGIAAHVYDTDGSERVPLYRLFHAGILDHFYTSGSEEKTLAEMNGYEDQGVAGWLASAP